MSGMSFGQTCQRHPKWLSNHHHPSACYIDVSNLVLFLHFKIQIIIFIHFLNTYLFRFFLNLALYLSASFCYFVIPSTNERLDDRMLSKFCPLFADINSQFKYKGFFWGGHSNSRVVHMSDQRNTKWECSLRLITILKNCIWRSKCA